MAFTWSFHGHDGFAKGGFPVQSRFCAIVLPVWMITVLA
jgi:hypothetical protein